MVDKQNLMGNRVIATGMDIEIIRLFLQKQNQSSGCKLFLLFNLFSLKCFSTTLYLRRKQGAQLYFKIGQ